MADFKYTISKGVAGTDTGVIKAGTRDEAEKLLKDKGYLVINLEELKQKKSNNPLKRNKVKLIDKVLFFDHLAQMLKAGLSLTDTLEALKEDTDNKYFKQVVEDIKYNIETGNTFSASMNKYPKIFSYLNVKIIEVGEIGGSLEESARQIATQTKKDYELRSKVKGALIYPEILISVMLIAGAGLLLFIVPQLSEFFKQANMKLPFTTQLLISISDFLKNDTILLIAMIIICVIVFKQLRKRREFNRFYDGLILRLPIVGPISHKMNMSIFARTLSSLLKSGVAIGKSLEIVSDASPNTLYKEAIMEFKDRIEKGEPLSVLMSQRQNLFTHLAVQMVAVGDKTGTTPDMLLNVAEFYQTQVNETLENISTIIEPIMLFIMGGATLFIALSIITPIYQLTSGITSSA